MSNVKKIINQFEVYVSAICLLAMVTILFCNVIGRYALKNSIKWAEEICLILFILSIYFGATGAIRTRQHLRLEIILGKLNPKTRMIMEILDNIIFMVFNVIILGGIMPLVLQLKKNGTATAVTSIPKYMIYVWLPILFIVMIIRLLQDCKQRVEDYKNDPTGEKKAALEEAAMRAMMVEKDEKEGE